MKLQQKILILFVSIALLIGGPLLWTIHQAARQVDLEEVAERGQVKMVDLAERIAGAFPAAQESSILPYLQSAQEQTNALYAVAIDGNGRVLAHTNVAEKGKIYGDLDTQMEQHANKPRARPVLYRGLSAMEVTVPVWSHTDAIPAEDFLLSGEKGSSEKKHLGLVRLVLPLDQVLQREYRLLSRIVAIVSFSGGVGIALLFLFMRRMLRPIQWLSEGTARIAKGDYGTFVPILSQDELGGLANDFNRMCRVLSETTVSKDYLGNILSHMIDPLIVIAMDGTLRMVNQATLDLLGYTKEDLEGNLVHNLFLRKKTSVMEVEEETLIMRGAVRNLELEFIKKSGDKVPVLFSSSVLKDNNGKPTGIIAVAKDVTERKRLESIVRQSDKMSAVGQLAAGVAHEINNPLGVILGFAQASIRRLKPGEFLEMPLRSIEKEAMRCKDLVQDLLTFSRVSKIEREPIDLNKTIEGALSLVVARARTINVEVRRELEPNMPRLLGNPNQIQQIMVNLANNAFDAMSEGGGLFTVKTESLRDGPLSWICLKVSDTGSGIPDEIITRIFEPFFTTKPVGKGTGLGLSLIHEIIKKHSGSIDVKSQPGHTEFQIKFPVRLSPEKREVLL